MKKKNGSLFTENVNKQAAVKRIMKFSSGFQEK